MFNSIEQARGNQNYRRYSVVRRSNGDRSHQDIAELKDLAPKVNVQLPAEMSSSQQSMLVELQGLNGDDCAKQYVSDQVPVHKDAVSLFQRYGKGGDDAELKARAVQMLPTLQHHLDMAQRLNK